MDNNGPYLCDSNGHGCGCAEPNVNELKLLFWLICSRFGTSEFRSLNWAKVFKISQ